MACLTTKGWMIKEGVILTGVLAEIVERIIYWLNNETKNKMQQLQKNSLAIVKIRIEFEEVFCEAYIYTQDNDNDKIVFLKSAIPFPEYIEELRVLIGDNKEISEKLINI